jgi:hypothetical protein
VEINRLVNPLEVISLGTYSNSTDIRVMKRIQSIQLVTFVKIKTPIISLADSATYFAVALSLFLPVPDREISIQTTY